MGHCLFSLWAQSTGYLAGIGKGIVPEVPAYQPACLPALKPRKALGRWKLPMIWLVPAGLDQVQIASFTFVQCTVPSQITPQHIEVCLCRRANFFLHASPRSPPAPVSLLTAKMHSLDCYQYCWVWDPLNDGVQSKEMFTDYSYDLETHFPFCDIKALVQLCHFRSQNQ